MSELIKTLTEGIELNSIADSDGFFEVSVHTKKGKELKSQQWSLEEYGLQLKKGWESYFKNTSVKPELLGFKIPVQEFLHETMHYIAPGSREPKDISWTKERVELIRLLCPKSEDGITIRAYSERLSEIIRECEDKIYHTPFSELQKSRAQQGRRF